MRLRSAAVRHAVRGGGPWPRHAAPTRTCDAGRAGRTQPRRAGTPPATAGTAMTSMQSSADAPWPTRGRPPAPRPPPRSARGSGRGSRRTRRGCGAAARRARRSPGAPGRHRSPRGAGRSRASPRGRPRSSARWSRWSPSRRSARAVAATATDRQPQEGHAAATARSVAPARRPPHRAVNPTASWGVNLVKRSITGTEGAKVPMTSTGTVTATSMSARPRLRTRRSSSGSST